MNLKVQKYLATHSLDELEDELSIRLCHHETLPLVILNYNQIESPKLNPIVRECRGLILEKDTWKVVSKNFTRFFNLGECLEDDSNFNWSNFTATEKHDGSLMSLWYYRDSWHCSTRGSFAGGNPDEFYDKTWEEFFWGCIPERISLPQNNSYIFEFVSPYNKIVRRYDEPELFLLAAFSTETMKERPLYDLGNYSKTIGVKMPELCGGFKNADEVSDFIQAQSDENATYEGLVLRDISGMRLKKKADKYVQLHHLRGEDSQFSPKRLFPFVFKDSEEKDELLTYFPEAKDTYYDLWDRIDVAYRRLDNLWCCYWDEKSQKKFSLAVKDDPLSGVLFNARKNNVSLQDAWEKSGDYILKCILKGSI